ncbi:hypothetical protein FOL47_003248 [Perkinsus chesapeaki]|uniref:EF-hand domain-containing protein n=1 Tax=Perkinsus chesapeaki TaxID=330153 RepID=A0A7J6N388_PERCH|nr:hypothetical protein FOL47_003248 [Perkinsus chesapeaki]
MGQRLPLPPIEHRARQIVSHYHIGAAELEKLWEVFTKIDKDRNGFWTLTECFILVKEQANSTMAPLLHALFYFADRGNDGNLSFDDFLVSFTSFCALSREEVLQFFFIVVDTDRNGYVSKDELMKLFEYRPPGVDSAPVFPLNNKRALRLFRNGDWDRLHFDDFAELSDSFPNLTFPAFHLQELFRKKLLDEEGQKTAKESMIQRKDEDMAKNPMLNIIRNPMCSYHVPYVTEEFRRVQAEIRKKEKEKAKRKLLAELNIPVGAGMDDYSISGVSEEWSPDVVF